MLDIVTIPIFIYNPNLLSSVVFYCRKHIFYVATKYFLYKIDFNFIICALKLIAEISVEF